MAISDCNKAIELDPTKAAPYKNRAGAYNGKGQYGLAIVDCDKALEIDPNYAKAYKNRGLAYKAMGKITEAIADFEKVIALTEDPELIEMARQQIEELSK